MMAQMANTSATSLFLLTGDNSFALRSERNRWVQGFAQKHGEDTIIRLDGENVTFRSLLDEVSSAPFLAEKRLVLIHGMPRWKKDEVKLLAEAVHPDTIVLVVHPKGGKRTILTKDIKEHFDIRECTALKAYELRKWLPDYAQTCGAQLEHAAVETLLGAIGEDQELLAREVEKLAVAADNGVITSAIVEKMVVPSSDSVIWQLTDYLSSGNKKNALLFARSLQERGGDLHGIWAVLLSFFRNVSVLHVAGGNAEKVAKECGIHPYVVKRMLPVARRLESKKMKPFISAVANADKALKTGEYRSTDEAPQELKALIDTCILSCPS